ncbi:MAG TPA: VOC family protein [Actinomycetes bacterium]|nr:VOC family protein [Actinomycetes bacterium]
MSADGHQPRAIFVNLPVKDLRAAREFFTKLGFSFNSAFIDGECACMVVDRNIFVMLLDRDRFADFVNGEISDATKSTEVLLCLTVDSKQQVDRMVATAIEAGGRQWKPTFTDGGMYGGSFQDLDGHVWELMYAPE